MAEMNESERILGQDPIDPITGLTFKNIKKKGKYVKQLNLPVQKQEGIDIASQLKNYNPSTDFNYRPALGEKSKYDVEITPDELDNYIESGGDKSLLEDYRSQRQSSGRAALFAINKGLLKTGINVIGGTVGTAYGIGSWIANGSFSKFYDNSVMNELDNWSKGLDAEMPVYKSSNYESDNLLENMFKNPVMFLDNATDAISFTAGAVLTGMLTGGIASASPYLRAASVVKKLSAAARVAEAGAEGAQSIAKGARLLKNASLADDILGNARKVVTGTAYESAVEANSLKNTMLEKAVPQIDEELKSKYQPEIDKLKLELQQIQSEGPTMSGNITNNGEQVGEFVDARQTRINHINLRLEAIKQSMDAERTSRLTELNNTVQKAGNANFIANMAILSISNATQFSSTFGMKWAKNNRAISALSGVKKEVTETGVRLAVPKMGKGMKALSNVGTFLKNPMTEGLWEEGMQGASSATFEDYYLRKYDPNAFGESRNIIESAAHGLGQSYGTNAGWKEIGMGMLMGSIGSPGRGILPGSLGRDSQTGKRGELWQGGIYGEFKEKAKKNKYIEDFVNEFNNDLSATNSSLGFKASVENFIRQRSLDNDRAAISPDDKKSFLDAKEDNFFGYVTMREKAGLGTTIDEDIDKASRMTPDEFIQNYGVNTDDIVTDSEENKEIYQQEAISNMKQQLASIRKNMSLVNRIEPSDPVNNYDPDIEDYKEQLAYILTKGEFIDKRSRELADNINMLLTKYNKPGLQSLEIIKDINDFDVTPEFIEKRNALRSKEKDLLTRNELINDNNERIRSLDDNINKRLNEPGGINETQTKVDKLNKDLDVETTNLNKQLASVEKSERRLSDKLARLESLKNQYDKSKSKEKNAENAQAITAEQESLKNELDKAQNDWMEADEFHKELINERDEIQTKLDDLTKKKDKVVKELTDAKYILAHDTAVRDQLQSDTNARQKELDAEQKELEKLKLETYTELYKKARKKHQLLSPEHEDDPFDIQSDSDYTFDNFEEFATKASEAIEEYEKLLKAVKSAEVDSPAVADDIYKALKDLSLLDASRINAIGIFNFFRSKSGRTRAIVEATKARKELFNKIYVQESEIESKIQEVLNDERINSEKGVPYTFEYNGKKIIGFVKLADLDGEQVPVFYSDNNEVILVKTDESGKQTKYTAVVLKAILQDSETYVEPRILSDEEYAELSEIKENASSHKVDTINGEYTAPGEIYEDNDGNQYFVVEVLNKNKELYKRVYPINDDGTFGPRAYTEADYPALKTMKFIGKETKSFAGEMVNFYYDKNDNIKKLGLIVDESPFMYEGEAKDKSTYPTTLKFVPNSGTEAQVIKDADTIKALIDDATKQMESGNYNVAKGTNYPIIDFNGIRGHLEYKIKQSKTYTYNKKNKKGRIQKIKRKIYFYKGETTFKSIELVLNDNVTPEALNKAIEEGTVNHLMFKPLNTTGRVKTSNYDITDIEILTEDFTSKSGEEYVVFKKGNKYYAAKKVQKIYQIYSETEQVAAYGNTRFDEDRLTYLGEKDNEAEVGSVEYADSVVLNPQNPSLNYVAGLDVLNELHTTANGNSYYADKRDLNDNIVYNDNPLQRNWYSYLKANLRTKEEFERFSKTHKLKVVINNSAENAKYFDDATDKSAINSNGTVDMNQLENLDIRVIIVDNYGNPVMFNGLPLVTSIHSTLFKNFTGVNKEHKDYEFEQLAKLRNLIANEINKHSTKSPNLFLKIDGVSKGRPVTEKAIINSEGKKTRVRNNVQGRLVPENTNANSIPWTVVKSGDVVDGKVSINVNGNLTEFAYNGNFSGQIFSGFYGMNGEFIPVKLLSRKLNTKEATTVAALFKQILNSSDPYNEKINGTSIIPNKSDNLKSANYYLKLFVKYGKNGKSHEKTQLYYDNSTNTVILGTKSFTKEDLNSKEGFKSFVAELEAIKNHNVSDNFKNGSVNVIHLNEDGEIVDEKFQTYNEYLFNEDAPVLQTDLVKIDNDNGLPTIVQPNLRFNDLSVDDTLIYTHEEYTGKRTDRNKASTTNNGNVFTSEEILNAKSVADSEDPIVGPLKVFAGITKTKKDRIAIIESQIIKEQLGNKAENTIENLFKAFAKSAPEHKLGINDREYLLSVLHDLLELDYYTMEDYIKQGFVNDNIPNGPENKGSNPESHANVTETFETKPTEQSSTQTIQDKKADIERRRQEEFKGNIVEEVKAYTITVRGKQYEVYEEKYDKNSPEYSLYVKRDNGEVVMANKNEKKIFNEEGENKQFLRDDTSEWIDTELQSKINAKYDAELAALENSTKAEQSGNSSSSTTTKQNIIPEYTPPVSEQIAEGASVFDSFDDLENGSKPSESTTSDNTFDFDGISSDIFDNSVKTRLVDNTQGLVTEDLTSIREWFSKNLPNMPLEVVDNILSTIKGDAWGAFTGKAVVLYKLAEVGTAYHEAFHVVYKLGLTTKDRNKLLDLVRAKYKGISDNEAEEILAEDFRNWMLNNKSELTSKDKSQRNIFRKLLDFIKSIRDLFLGKKGEDLLLDIYSKINRGGYSHINTKDSKESNKDNWKLRVVGDLDVQQTEDLFSGIISEMMTKFRSKYNGDFSVLNENILNLLNEVLKENANKIGPAIGVDNWNKLFKTKEGLTDFSAVIKDYFRYIGIDMNISYRENKDENTNANPTSNTGEDVTDSSTNEVTVENAVKSEYSNHNEVSNISLLNNEIKILVSSLAKKEINADGRPVTVINSVGLPVVIDFAVAYNTLLKTLHGTTNIEGENGMLDKLDRLSRTKPEYLSLYNLLKNVNGLNGILLRNKFRQAFSINKYNYLTYLVGNSDGKFIQSDMNRMIDKVKAELDADFKQSTYFKAVNRKEAITHLTKLLADLDAVYPKYGQEASIPIYLRPLLEYLNFKDINIQALSNRKDIIGELSKVIKEFLINKSDTKNITDISSGRFNKFLEFVALGKNDIVEASHKNPNNKNTYEYSYNNYYSTIINEVKHAISLKTREDRYTYMKVNLPHIYDLLNKDYSLIISTIKNALDSGYLNEDIGVTYLEGMSSEMSGDKGEVTYDLSSTDIALMHVESFLLRNTFTFRRPSDKALEPAFNGLFKAVDVNSIYPLGLKYLQYELDNGSLKVFDFVLSDKTKEALKESNNSLTPKIKQMFKLDLENYLNKEINENKKIFKELKIINDKESIFSKELRDKYNTVDDIVAAFTANYIISRMEQHIVFLGDYGQFKQLYKRTSGPVGTGETFSQDKMTNDYIENGYQSRLNNNPESWDNNLDLIMDLSPARREQLGMSSSLITLPYTGNSTNISILKDKILNLKDYDKALYDSYHSFLLESLKKQGLSDAKANKQTETYMKIYEEMVIADGAGFISFDKYRSLFLKTGKWSYSQERVYNKIVRGEPIKPEELAYFPVIKPQGFGPKGFDLIFEEGVPFDIERTGNFKLAFEKLSLIPLIPTVIKGTTLEDLSNSMKMSGSHISIFESGFKDANIENVNDYDSGVQYLSSFNQDLKYWKIQLQIHPEVEESDIDGTQQRKQLFQDLFESGKPIDYSGSTLEWENETDKSGKSNIYKLYKEYTDNYSELIELEKQAFMEELTIEYNKDTGSYIVKDYVKFASELRKEISSRRLPSNIVSAITTDEKGNLLFPIDALPIADKIENILFARAINNTIRLKRTGAAYVQTPSVFWKNSIGNTGIEKFSKRLKFVRLENGKIQAAEVYLPNYMRNIIGDVSDAKLEELMKSNPEMFKLMGYRIPTQGQNSMLPMIVKGFLPAEMGDTIILPYEIVGQSGSDFDIDKLHVFRPNFIKHNGKPVYLSSSNYNKIIAEKFENEILDSDTNEPIKGESKLRKKLLQNKILEIQLEILSNVNVGKNLLQPNNAEFLKEEAAYTEYLKYLGRVMEPTASMLRKESKEFKEFLVEYNKQVKGNLGQMLSYSHELQTGMTFKGGKKGVAIVANYSTFHTLCQSSGVFIGNKYYKKKLVLSNGKKVITYEETPIIFNFKTNYDSLRNRHLLGRVTDISGNSISELYSEHLTANVDIAKDPFIFKLNTNTITSNVKYMMIALGSDKEFINRFLTQPIIEDYVNMTLINESISIESRRRNSNTSLNYETKDDIINKLTTKYGGKAHDIDALMKIHEAGSKLSINDLNLMIVKTNRLNPDYSGQLQVFADFLAYVEYAKEFAKAVQSIKPDTAKIKNNSEATAFISNLQDVYESKFVNNVDNFFKNTVLKGFGMNHASLYKKLYKSLFLTEANDIQELIYDNIRLDLAINNRKLNEREIDYIRQGIMTYLLQKAVNKYVNNSNLPMNREQFSDALITDYGKNKRSIPLFMKNLADNEKNQTNPNIVLLDFLYATLADVPGDVDVLKTIVKKLDVRTADLVSDGFSKILKSSPEIYNKLLTALSMQSGMVYGVTNFIQYMDSTNLANVLSPVINSVKSYGIINNMDIEKFLDNLYLSKKSNKTLVPLIGEKSVEMKFKGEAFLVAPNNRNYGRRMLKIRKNVDSSPTSKTYDKVYKFEGLVKTAKGKKALYVLMNAKSSYMLQEFHESSESILIENSNYYITDNQRRAVIDSFKDSGLELVNNLNTEVNYSEYSYEDYLANRNPNSTFKTEEEFNSWKAAFNMLNESEQRHYLIQLLEC